MRAERQRPAFVGSVSDLWRAQYSGRSTLRTISGSPCRTNCRRSAAPVASLRVVSESWNPAHNQLTLEVSGRAGGRYELQVWNPQPDRIGGRRNARPRLRSWKSRFQERRQIPIRRKRLSSTSRSRELSSSSRLGREHDKSVTLAQCPCQSDRVLRHRFSEGLDDRSSQSLADHFHLQHSCASHSQPAHRTQLSRSMRRAINGGSTRCSTRFIRAALRTATMTALAISRASLQSWII